MNRPGRAVTLFDAVFLSQFKRFKFEISINVVIGFKIVVINFELKITISFWIIAFFLKPIFGFFYRFLDITQEALNILKIWLLHMKERHKVIQNHFSFYLIKHFLWRKKTFFVKITYFHMTFFLQIGPGRVKYGRFKQFKHDYQFSTKI